MMSAVTKDVITQMDADGDVVLFVWTLHSPRGNDEGIWYPYSSGHRAQLGKQDWVVA